MKSKPKTLTNSSSENDLSSVTGTHLVEGKNQLSQIVLWLITPPPPRPDTYTRERDRKRERIRLQVLHHMLLGKQNDREIQPHTPIGTAKIQNTDNNKCWQRYRTQELFRMAGGDTKWCFRGQLIGFSPNQMHSPSYSAAITCHPQKGVEILHPHQ